MINNIQEYKNKLIEASRDGDEQIINLILENEEIIYNLIDEFYEDETFAPMHIAAENGNTNCLELLLTKFDVNKLDDEGRTCIQCAVEEEKMECVKVLIENQADLSLISNDGRSPLYRAVESENEEIIDLLLEYNAPIDLMTNRDGWTCLHLASRMGYYDLSIKLIDHKADINLKDKDERTPLHLSSKLGYVDIVKLLIDNKANINEINKEGKSSLHLAAELHLSVVKLLLKNGVNSQLKDNEGKLAIQIAEEHDKKEIARYINNFEMEKKGASGENSTSRNVTRTNSVNNGETPLFINGATLEEAEELKEEAVFVKSKRKANSSTCGTGGFSNSETEQVEDHASILDQNLNTHFLDQSTILGSSVLKGEQKKTFLQASLLPLSILFGVSVAFGVYHFMKKKDSATYESQGSDLLIEEIKKNKN